MSKSTLLIHDAVRRASDRAVGTVRQMYRAGNRAIVEWPSGLWTSESVNDITRVNQHPITPTPLSGD